MFTRAYDVIMCGMHVAGRYTDAFKRTELSDTILNAKNYAGTIRSLNLAGAGTHYGGGLDKAGTPPFANFIGSTGVGETALFPDEDSSEPDYEDYQTIDVSVPTGWTSLTLSESSESFDAATNEYVCIVKTMFSNTSGAEKTVYGIAIRYKTGYKSSLDPSSGTTLSDYFLIAREHFASPITVPAGGTIKLSLTYRVSRHGVRIENANGGV